MAGGVSAAAFKMLRRVSRFFNMRDHPRLRRLLRLSGRGQVTRGSPTSSTAATKSQRDAARNAALWCSRSVIR